MAETGSLPDFTPSEDPTTSFAAAGGGVMLAGNGAAASCEIEPTVSFLAAGGGVVRTAGATVRARGCLSSTVSTTLVGFFVSGGTGDAAAGVSLSPYFSFL